MICIKNIEKIGKNPEFKLEKKKTTIQDEKENTRIRGFDTTDCGKNGETRCFRRDMVRHLAGSLEVSSA